MLEEGFQEGVKVGCSELYDMILRSTQNPPGEPKEELDEQIKQVQNDIQTIEDAIQELQDICEDEEVIGGMLSNVDQLQNQLKDLESRKNAEPPKPK